MLTSLEAQQTAASNVKQRSTNKSRAPRISTFNVHGLTKEHKITERPASARTIGETKEDLVKPSGCSACSRPAVVKSLKLIIIIMNII